jgi:hypothetical protein
MWRKANYIAFDSLRMGLVVALLYLILMFVGNSAKSILVLQVEGMRASNCSPGSANNGSTKEDSLMKPLMRNNDKYVPLCCFGSGSLAKHEKENADTLENRQNLYA